MAVGAFVGVRLIVGVTDGVTVAVGVFVGVRLIVGVTEGVTVLVGVGVGMTRTPSAPQTRACITS